MGRVILFSLLLFLLNKATGQSYASGRVLGENGQYMAGAYVVLLENDSLREVTFTLSDDTGFWELADITTAINTLSPTQQHYPLLLICSLRNTISSRSASMVRSSKSINC